MATTTNYSWETPDDTDLVKDGAAAIRTLGSSIDTTTKALNPSTTLGDIEYRSATANTNTRLAIGSTGNVLTVSGGVPTWAAPASSGGMTVIASGNLTTGNNTTTLSSIPTTYKNLVLVLRDLYASTGSYYRIRVNGITTASYGYVVFNHTAVDTVSVAAEGAATSISTTYNGIAASDNNHFTQVNFDDYANTVSNKSITFNGVAKADGASFNRLISGAGQIQTTNAITSISIITSDGTWSGGSYILYGVN